MTMRGVQGPRVPFFEHKAELNAIEAQVLVIAGDENDSTLDIALFFKRNIPRCGHTLDLEVLALFN